MALREILARFSFKINSAPLLAANKQILGAVGSLQAMGAAFGVIAAKNFLKDTIAVGDSLDKQSRQTGVSTEALQRWQVAADRAGVGSSDLATAFRQVQKNAFMAEQGSKMQAQAFKDLGVEVKDTSGNFKDADVLLREMAGGLSAMPDSSKKAAISMTLLGRSGSKLVPLLGEGTDALDEALARIDKFGGPIGKDFIKNAADAQDALADWGTATTLLKTAIVGRLLPGITRGFTKISVFVGEVAKGAKNTDIFKNAIIALGTIAAIAGAKALLPWLPMLIAIALAVLLFDDLKTAIEGGDSAIKNFVDDHFGKGTFDEAVKDLTKAWGDLKVKIKDVGKELVATIEEMDRGVNQFGDLPDLLYKDFKRAMQSISTAISEKIGELPSEASLLIAALMDPVRVIPYLFQTLGSEIVNGLVDGLRARLQYAINEAKNLGRSVINAAKDTLGIKSPSKVFFEIGSMVPAGAVRGIESGQRGVDDALARLFGSPSAPARGVGGSVTQHNSWNISTPGGGGPNDYARAVVEKSRELMREERESAMAAVARYAEA